jgi:peptidoglycan/xylan/chitin deacetylase (PgdA/CDA1 family)
MMVHPWKTASRARSNARTSCFVTPACRARFLRPPHLSKFVILPYVLGRMQKLPRPDVDPEEWKRRPAAVMTESILSQVRPGSIISLHDPMGAETLRTLENILPALAARGFQFETVSALVRRQARP